MLNESDYDINSIRKHCLTVFSRRIREVMHDYGLSYSEFAELIGVAKPTVFKYVSGLRLPSMERLVLISKLTGRSIDWFFDCD